jgi:cytoskeleton protein RodZ
VAGEQDQFTGSAPGRALAAARTAQNLSIADVARQLKLTPGQVEALEAGAFDRLPGPVFVRGFIRNYARLLRMDPEPVLQAAEASIPAQAAQAAAPPSRNIPFPDAVPRRWPRYAMAGGLVVAALAVYEFHGDGPQEPAAPPSSSAVPAPVEQPVAQPSAAPSVAEPQAGPDAGAQVASVQAPSSADAAAATGPQPAQSALPAGVGRIALVFEKESWVQIRDGKGKTIFLKHNQPGTQQVIEGAPPLTLVIGNAHGVRLTYNDRPVDLSRHAKVDVARLTLE